MSTKIYNGFKIEGVRSAYELNEMFTPFKKTVKKIAKRDIKLKYAELAIEAIDSASRGDLPSDFQVKFDNHSPMSWAFNIIESHYRTIYNKGERDPEFDFDCHVSLLPMKSKTLAIVYADKDSYLREFKKLPNVSEYAFWNNSDKPAKVSKKDWEQRSKDWDSVLETFTTPSQGGLSFECLGIYGLPMPTDEEVLKAIPSFEARRNKIAKDIAYYESPRGQNKSDKFEYSKYLAFREWLQTSEGKAFVETLGKRLSCELIEKITMFHLTERLAVSTWKA